MVEVQTKRSQKDGLDGRGPDPSPPNQQSVCRGLLVSLVRAWMAERYWGGLNWGVQYYRGTAVQYFTSTNHGAT